MGYFERKLRFLHKKGPSAYPGENRTVLVAVVSRMIIVPLIMLPFIALIAKYDLFPAAEDPVFILSAVLLVSSVCNDLAESEDMVNRLTAAAPGFDTRADHAGRIGRCVRETNLKNHLMVIRSVDSAVRLHAALQPHSRADVSGLPSRTLSSAFCLAGCEHGGRKGDGGFV
jgi:hypothetical protein